MSTRERKIQLKFFQLVACAAFSLFHWFFYELFVLFSSSSVWGDYEWELSVSKMREILSHFRIKVLPFLFVLRLLALTLPSIELVLRDSYLTFLWKLFDKKRLLLVTIILTNSLPSSQGRQQKKKVSSNTGFVRNVFYKSNGGKTWGWGIFAEYDVKNGFIQRHTHYINKIVNMFFTARELFTKGCTRLGSSTKSTLNFRESG